VHVAAVDTPDLLLAPNGDRQLRWIWAKDHRLPVRLSAARRPAPHDTRGAPESCAPRPIELVELGAGKPPGPAGKPIGRKPGFHA